MHQTRNVLFTIAVATALFAPPAWGQTANTTARIGYLYPAGARRGATMQIVVGGQFLRGANAVRVSGTGVHAEVVRICRPIGNIRTEQRAVLTKQMADALHARLEEAGIDAAVVKRLREQAQKRWDTTTKKIPNIDEAKPLDHPMLDGLAQMSVRELANVKSVMFFPRQKLQPNRQLAETVLLKIVVAADAPPGDRELRLGSKTWMTNPLVFQVGQRPEVKELEPNDRIGGPDPNRNPQIGKVKEAWKLMERPVHDVPVLLNGQIRPGDIDRWTFRAKKGQKLVIDVDARQLMPYLADAVPGWFQATLAIHDSKGREVAYMDDFEFRPDPVLYFEVPEDGKYELTIRDSIYRGREDFVYRIAIGEQPFVTHIFPLGGKEGAAISASVTGWNLTATQLKLDTKPGAGRLRLATFRSGAVLSNAVPYAVGTLPEAMETASNNTPKAAQSVTMPIIVNGRIEKPGDKDVFSIKGKAGDEVVLEVQARQLGSPMDSLVRLIDKSGKVLAWNDDFVDKRTHLHVDRIGLVTHHADSYLKAKLPKDGTYYVQISDVQNHGGDGYGYRLRISAPQPDFALRATPSSLFMRPGACMPMAVYVLRQDGFDGEIEVKAPEGFAIAGGKIPAGVNYARMTLGTVGQGFKGAAALKLTGTADIGGQAVTREAVGAENTMQAFLWRHLVPTDEMMVLSQKQKWKAVPMSVATVGTVRIPIGGSQKVEVETRRGPAAMKNMVLELDEAPAGLKLSDMAVDKTKLSFVLAVDADATESFSGNVIVSMVRIIIPKAREGAPPPKPRRWLSGYLPAIPVEIVVNK
jgi:hypothetical protein